MFGDVRNLKASDIELKQRLPPLECEWLVGQLRSRPGDVLDFLSQCGGVQAAVRPVRI